MKSPTADPATKRRNARGSKMMASISGIAFNGREVSP
jgi:hypothetical protein